MKNNIAFTLLELLMAMSLLVLVVMAGTCLFLNSTKMFQQASDSAKAQRNAQIVLMHMERYIKSSATALKISNNNKTLAFKTYAADLSDFSSSVFEDNKYEFVANKDTGGIVFTSGEATIVFNNIKDCSFELPEDDWPLLNINIAAMSDRGTSTYCLSSQVGAEYSAAPGIYLVDDEE